MKYVLFLLFLFFPPQHLLSYELGIVVMFRNEAGYLKEWIEYHRMLGVDHFLLYNDRSDDDFEAVLEPYISSKLVEIIDWENDGVTPVFPTWQVMAFQDGLRRSIGNTKWLAFIDIDEFILPKKNATILKCLNQFFNSASGVYICWRHFGTGGIYLNPKVPILTKLTACSEVLHSQNAAGKSIVKVDAVDIDQMWSPHHFPLKEGAQYYTGSGKKLYFKGIDLQVNPYHTSDFIQINHYVMRDENFYQNKRLPLTKMKTSAELALLLEHYQSFNATHDYAIIRFLRKHHSSLYHSFWRKKP